MLLETRKIEGTNLQAGIYWTDEETPQLNSIEISADDGRNIVITADELLPLKSLLSNVLTDAKIQEDVKKRRQKSFRNFEVMFPKPI